MKFRFIGEYTGKRSSINVGGSPDDGGVTFEGSEPADVTNEDLIRRLSGNPDFEAVGSPKKAEKVADDKEMVKELRAAYVEKFGKKPFSGWDANTLQEKLS